MKIWCPSCKEDKFKIESRKAPDPCVVWENILVKIGQQDDYRTCEDCGTNLERK